MCHIHVQKGAKTFQYGGRDFLIHTGIYPMKFYDGHLVYSVQGNSAAIGIMLTDDGVQKLMPLDPLEKLLATMTMCGKPFERRDSYLGTMLVCSADDATPTEIDLEIRDLEECLRRNFDLDLRRIDQEHLRPFEA